MGFLWWRKPQRSSSSTRSRRKPFLRLQLEALEERRVPATLMVTNTNDTGAGSFRQALIDANNTTANPGQNTIHFAIATSGVQTIKPATALPIVTNTAGVIIDATTEGGFAGTPLVVLDGSNAGASNGLIITGGNSTIKGLAIDKFASGAGIDLASSHNTVQGNFIGVDATGTSAAANLYGVYLPAGATNNTIGGTTAAARNVISGNTVFGILLEGTGTSNNLIEGNRIGTDASGNTGVPNLADGVAFTGASNNTLGGSTSGAGNQISDNAVIGVLLSGNGTTGNVLEGNNIGLNAAQNAKEGNAFDGVAVLSGATGNTIGSAVSALAGNVISGNGRFGVLLAAANNVLLNNLIGTDVTGTVALGNTFDGVGINGANNTIGGTATNAGNVISGNGRFGIFLTGPGATGSLVTSNTLGATKGGATALGNTYDGVALAAGATNNTIGGTTAAAGNELSGNNRFGVFVTDSGTTGNMIAGNDIGMTGSGTAALANTFDGVAILSGASSNTVGGTVSGAMNVIASNGRFGVLLGVSGTTSNVVAANHIGTGAAGKVAFPNLADGVAILTASGNTIGGTVSGTGNLIAGNHGDGVLVNGCANTLIAGNLIGTDINGTAALANTDNGVDLTGGAVNNTVGGTVTAARNLISGNTLDGVLVVGATGNGTNSTGNLIEGNFIGTDTAGTTPIANGRDGVETTNGAAGNTVGGTATGARNVISGNAFAGINLVGPTVGGNLVQGNFIGTDAAGTHALANGSDGVGLVGAGAGNQTVGGTTAAARNIISGNTGDGILIDGSQNNLVEGNYIGTDVGGTTAVANAINGVEIFNGASNNTIGGTLTGQGNVISGNTQAGVMVLGGTTGATNVTGTLIQGNFIGTDTGGTMALPNLVGVDIRSATGNTVGGTVSRAENVISGNTQEGVLLEVGANSNVVENNLVGTDFTGTVAVPNFVGVEVNASATNTIGGTLAQDRNVISGNASAGMLITGSASIGNVVLGNLIGVDITGSVALHNSGDGLDLTSGASGNTIGSPTHGNIISGNQGNGIGLTGTDVAATTNNVIEANFLGTNGTGTVAIPNLMHGLEINDAANNTIGGTVALSDNLLSGNTKDGLLITGSLAAGNVVQRNIIGTDIGGTFAIPNHGNAGVEVSGGASGNTIGGTLASATANLISGNTLDGILLNGTTGNLIEDNFIGTNFAGTVAIANGNDGVDVNNANGNTIGGTVTGARNIISGNTQYGVALVGSSANVVLGNFIGTDNAGTAALPNQGNAGVGILGGSQENLIGGTATGAGNLISGNKDGIDISGTTTLGNLVQGNTIGLDTAGTMALPNTTNGITITDAPNNTIGGTLTGARNVISGNDADGILITGTGATTNLVEGNYIGTDPTGVNALPNGGNAGVEINADASTNTIGGTVTGAGNLISGNAGDGVLIGGTTATANVVAGNKIGTNAAGNAGLPNIGIAGVDIDGAPGNTIGGTVTAARNTISGNTGDGIFIGGTTAMSNVVENNFIGTDMMGTAAVLNGGNAGVEIANGASNNIIGGTVTGAGNVISGNAVGVVISGMTTTGNLLQANFIGTDATGTTSVANDTAGVQINNAPGNTVGGTLTAARNVISGNLGDGIDIMANSASNNVVEGNFIGTDVTGTVALPNNFGVSIMAPANTIGGTVAGAGNVISGNDTGVDIEGSIAAANVVQGNLIGTDATGTVALGNTGNGGVRITAGATNNLIGGTVAGAGNVISGNSTGILMTMSGTTGNLIQGNFIGSDMTGTINVGNTGPGVDIEAGAKSNTVGGTVAGAGNVIAFNNPLATSGIGVKIGSTALDSATVGDAVLGNSIHNNGGSGGLGIDLGANGHTANHVTSPSSGPNDFQNFPVPTEALLVGTPQALPAVPNVTVSFTFSSVPSSTFLLEFFLNNAGDTPQGRIFLGSVVVTTDSSGALATVTGGSVSAGVGSITLTPPAGVTPAIGQLLTGTATLLSPGGTGAGTVGDTSEFSGSVPVTAAT
jgi:parallel beta-helix repeat protein